jgi:hypothetical protein
MRYRLSNEQTKYFNAWKYAHVSMMWPMQLRFAHSVKAENLAAAFAALINAHPFFKACVSEDAEGLCWKRRDYREEPAKIVRLTEAEYAALKKT